MTNEFPQILGNFKLSSINKITMGDKDSLKYWLLCMVFILPQLKTTQMSQILLCFDLFRDNSCITRQFLLRL